jgi:UDP-glucose 4-epimerase
VVSFRGQGRSGDGLRYFVTGGAGFIGSHLIDALIARGDSVLIADDLSTGARANIEHLLDSPQVDFIEGSVLDEQLVDDCMGRVDACFHLASVVGVQLVVDRALETLLRNVRGNDIVMAAAARRRRRIFFTSTSEIYGKNESSGITEEDDRILGSPFKARWSYSTAKAFGEALAAGYHRDHGLETVTVRLFNTVGPRQTGQYGMVVPRFVRQALGGHDITVYGDGTQSRCFTHVYDVVNAILRLSDDPRAHGKVYNVGAPTEVKIHELAQLVIDRVGTDSRVVFVPYEEAYDEGFEELGRRVPDTTALRALTGWRPTRSVQNVIDDVIAFQRGCMPAMAGGIELAS